MGKTMVQVDIFWSFALGAGFATAASRQIKTEDKPFEGPYFVKTLLFLSIFFVPSGTTLLWGFPEWETMQVGTYHTIPAWLVALFSATNMTQGIIGYWLAFKFIRADNAYGAQLIVLLGYFCMFFILVHGWDGTGYQRFFYDCRGWGTDLSKPWTPGDIMVFKWLVSPVAFTLYAMGFIMLPLLFHWISKWIKEGYQLGKVNSSKAMETSRGNIINGILRLIFIHTLGGAIMASLLIRFLGLPVGSIAFALAAYFVLLRKGGLTHREFFNIYLEEES